MSATPTVPVLAPEGDPLRIALSLVRDELHATTAVLAAPFDPDAEERADLLCAAEAALLAVLHHDDPGRLGRLRAGDLAEAARLREREREHQALLEAERRVARDFACAA